MARRLPFLPDSIAGWTVLVLVTGLLVSHVVALAVFAGNRFDTLSNLVGRHTAERIAGVVRLVDETPPPERQRVLRALEVPGLRAAWGTLPAVEDAQASGVANIIADILRHRLDVAEVRVALVPGDGPVPMMGHRFESRSEYREFRRQWREMRQMWAGAPFGEAARVSVRLPDGSWLNFVAPLDVAEGLWRPRFAFPFLVLTLAVLALSVFALRRTTRPFVSFAAAAERLGVDVAAPPLPEKGPREVRAAAQAFNRMQTRLRRFVEDRTQMLAAISHDLRTPITRLRLRAEFVEDNEQRAKLLGDLDEMERMIAATLSFARDDASVEPRCRLDLAALAQGVVDDVAAAGGEAAYEGPDEFIVEGRPTALKRALVNLVENAVKYGERARLRLRRDAGLAVIEIADDGPGIPEAEMERVFAPFHRLDPSRNRETGGTGLGLAVARSVVRGHGGDVTLCNRAGGGLVATMTLPADAGRN